ncbi:MAG: hypothetical protein NTX82_03890 [Candidatus Parcubacteria bacterium]|nr:hypothetical protein [Candidatus Parcubacteria bacterium]
MQEKISSKKKELVALRSEYQGSIQKLESEIRTEKRKKGIKSYHQASSNSRISYDLALIQRKEAYIAKLDEVTPKLEEGTNELEFLRRQAEDDLKMETALGSEQLEELTEDIDNAIKKYLPQSEEFAIEVDKDSLPSVESIWQRISGD